MSDDVTVLEDEIEAYADGTVARVSRFRRQSDLTTESRTPTITARLAQTFEIDFPGLVEIYRAWRAALPPEKRPDW